MTTIRLKPLQWHQVEQICTKWQAAALGGQYELVALDGEDGGWSVNFSWGRPLAFWFIQGEPDEWGPTGPKKFADIEDAKAAAEVDRAARVAGEFGSAIADVATERIRQVFDEGWSSAHDDGHVHDEMAYAAACYTLPHDEGSAPGLWPWDAGWWKPKNRRADLVRAAALIVAEIERLDRRHASDTGMPEF